MIATFQFWLTADTRHRDVQGAGALPDAGRLILGCTPAKCLYPPTRLCGVTVQRTTAGRISGLPLIGSWLCRRPKTGVPVEVTGVSQVTSCSMTERSECFNGICSLHLHSSLSLTEGGCVIGLSRRSVPSATGRPLILELRWPVSASTWTKGTGNCAYVKLFPS